ncbi:MAG: hypothetical protein E6R07_07350 [Nevskiaceae bacterium]|nr:MAG: hypothetical protein E6R07_07350 [Nevskiaceae bacterium]
MTQHVTMKMICLAACIGVAPFAVMADDSNAPADANMMGHSPASKEHTMMNQTSKLNQAPDAPSSPSNGMGHSPASKEHTMMNQTKNQSGNPDAPASGPDNGMGHSPASKEHHMMKHKKGKSEKHAEDKAD